MMAREMDAIGQHRSATQELEKAAIALGILVRSLLRKWQVVAIVVTLATISVGLEALRGKVPDLALASIVVPLGIAFVPLLNVTFYVYLVMPAAAAPVESTQTAASSINVPPTSRRWWLAIAPTSNSMRVAISFWLIIAIIQCYGIAFQVLGINLADGTELQDLSIAGRAFIAFYYSVVTFATLGYGDVTASSMFGRMMAIVEVLNGFIAFGVLVGYVSNLVNEMRSGPPPARNA